jgi:hypothetical protein
MDPGARAALLIAILAAVAVLAAAAFVAPLAPVLALAAGLAAGWSYIRFTRREIPARAGQGGLVAAPPIVLAQGLGTALNLLLLGGGYRLGARMTHLHDGARSLDLPLPMTLALIVLTMLLDLALVLVAAEWAARRAVASRN